jgi:hypothetical protein
MGNCWSKADRGLLNGKAQARSEVRWAIANAETIGVLKVDREH